MSLSILAQGTLAAAPQQRTGKSGKPFTTFLLRVPIADDAAMLVSGICFDQAACRTLAALGKGETIAVSGRAKLAAWQGKDGEQHSGLSVIAESVLTAYQAKSGTR